MAALLQYDQNGEAASVTSFKQFTPEAMASSLDVPRQGPQGISGWLALVALVCASAALFSIVEISRVAPGLWLPQFADFLPLTVSVFILAIISAVLAVWRSFS